METVVLVTAQTGVSEYLAAIQRLAPLIREQRRHFDEQRRIPDQVFAALADAGLFRLYLPKTLGGPELSPFDFMTVVEAASALDGSIGWLVGNGGGMSRIAGYLPEKVTREWFAYPHAFITSATGAIGTAEPVEGGYRVSGRWTFGSGCHEAKWMLGSFQILDDGQPRRREDGGMFWRGVFPRAEVEVIPGSWDVTGLRGTGSFDWTVKDFFLPERRTMIHAGVPLDNQWGH